MSAATTREERARRKRAVQQQAQQLALNGEWTEAVSLNQEILTATPEDVPALNRLGKALSELGRYGEAYEAYSKSYKIDPANQIARRNLQRLEPLKNLAVDASIAERGHAQARQTMFIEEIGKTRVTELLHLADATTLARMISGDQVELRIEGRQVGVYSEDGARLGQLEPRLAHRLITLIEGGNRYSAAITVVETDLLRIIIRETFQHASQVGRLSFPVDGKPLTQRAYTRATERLYAADDTDLYSDDDEAEETEETEEEEEFAEADETMAEEPEEDQAV